MQSTDTTATSETPWQLVLAVGDAAEWADGLGEATVTVSADPGVLDEVALGAADLRARAVVAVPGSDIGSVTAWAYLSGLAGRILDVVTRTGASVESLDCTAAAAAGRAADGPRPDERVESVTLDVAAAAAGFLDAADAGAGRWAKRATLRWCEGMDLYRAAAWVAGLRDRRGDGGRLPQIDVGGHVVDLEGTRLRGAARRRHTNAAAHAPLADPAPLTARQQRLCDAASRPVETVLVALGSGRDGDLWNCPRPQRHTHGDAVPSMRTSGNAVRCFRCDAEWTDPVRLVMDVTGLGADDAAGLLLDGDDALGAFRERIVAERRARSAVG